jgi:hypothetical protein
MGLPRVGTIVEDLACKKCGKKVSEAKDCQESDCPQAIKSEEVNI